MLCGTSNRIRSSTSTAKDSGVLALEIQANGRTALAQRHSELIREMAADNTIWGEERIAHQLKRKLGIIVSPRTVGKYLRTGGPVRTPDPRQRWLTFVPNHAQAMVACDFFVVVTATFPHSAPCTYS
jgi:hypothetical protein